MSMFFASRSMMDGIQHGFKHYGLTVGGEYRMAVTTTTRRFFFDMCDIPSDRGGMRRERYAAAACVVVLLLCCVYISGDKRAFIAIYSLL